jgi:hypothetical protein
MKNLLTFLLTISVLVFLSGASASAQGRGLGNGPSVGQGHGQDVGHGQVKTGSNPNGNHDSHTDWQTKLSDRFQNDSAFATKIKNLLGPTTTDAQLQAAMMGFRNGGQFTAAMHVAKNLGIPFDELKAKMTGVSTNKAGQTVTTTPMSLGKAILQLKPTMTPGQANDAAKIAEKQGSEDIDKTTKTASK